MKRIADKSGDGCLVERPIGLRPEKKVKYFSFHQRSFFIGSVKDVTRTALLF